MSCSSAGEDAFALTCLDLLPRGFSFIFVFTQKGEALPCVQYFWDSLPPHPPAFPVPEAGVSSALVLNPPKRGDPLTAPTFLQKRRDSFGSYYPWFMVRGGAWAGLSAAL